MKKYVVLILIYYLLLILIRVVLVYRRPSLTLRVLDVGQGDSILIDYKGEFKILVDAGTGKRVEDLLLDYFILPVCNLDVVYITHLHLDHFGGILPVLNMCKIGILWFNDVTLTTESYRALKEKIGENKNINKVLPTIYVNNKIEYGDLKIISLWPTETFTKNLKPSDDLNRSSTVLFVDFNDFEALLTGDAESEVLDALDLTRIMPMIQGGLDVLKVPHHGSKKGLSAEFLAKLKPRTCVISVGSVNSYGHPSDTALSLLSNAGCTVRRTDLEGTIEFGIN